MDYGYTYNRKFQENILVVGQTGCGKTTFFQTLAKNKMFGELQEIFWITKALLNKKNISSNALINMLILIIRNLWMNLK